MHKVFVDADVILDLLAKREPFFSDSARLFVLIEKKEVSGFTSPLIIANIYYVLRKHTSKKTAIASIRRLRSLLDLLPLTQTNIDRALESSFTDFEDAIQHEVALNNNMDFIITRNTKDYKKSELPAMSAKEYFLMWHVSS